MAGPTQGKQGVRFGIFEVDLRAGELRRRGLKVKLQEKPFQVLALLLEHPGKVVTREEIRQKLWPADTFVDFDRSINGAIKKLRLALGDSANSPRFVETLPRRGYRLIAPVDEPGRPKPPTGKIMLSVLPFENFSGDQDYFSDGLTEEMITQLGALHPEGLGIIARTTAMHYKGTGKTIEQIGHELGVDYILEGSVRREGDRVRITAQLIQVCDQTHLWAKSYERDLSSILMLQSEVAQAIASEIKLKLKPQEQAQLAKARVVNSEAHEAYLKGNYYWNKFTEEGFKRALDYFETAVEKDLNYAPAYARLAASYGLLGLYGNIPPREAFPTAKSAVLKALEIDDTLAEGHSTLGMIRLVYEWDWTGAEREFQRALEINPSHWEAHEVYAFYLEAVGRLQEAIAQSKQALELDPLSLITNTDVGLAFYIARQYDQAIEQCRKTLEMDQHFIVAHECLGRAYLQKRMFEEAISEFQKTVTLSQGKARFIAFLGEAYGMSGKRDEALGLLEELKKRSSQSYVSAYDIARIHLALGKKDHTLDWLKKAYEERVGFLAWLNVDPAFDPLRPDPRFQSLLRRMNFPE